MFFFQTKTQKKNTQNLLFVALLFQIIFFSSTNTQKLATDDSLDFTSPAYQALSAEEKLNKLWLKLSEKPQTYGWYSAFQIYTLLFRDVKPSFTEVSDVFISQRKKLIHAVGMVAKAKVFGNESAKSKYSGVFKGCENALVRLSLSKEPNYSYASAAGAEVNFTPGVALKCLRDKVPSANFLAMFSVDGQKSWNFFRNDVSNQIAKSKSLMLKPLELKFSQAQDETGFLGLLPLAQYDEKGNLEKEIKFPFKLIFRPSKNLQQKLPDEFSKSFFEQIKEVKKDSVLYEIYAMDKPGDSLERIGKVVITTPFIQSEFGDRFLYFQHNYLEYDKKMRPELLEHYNDAEKYTVQENKTKNPDM